MDIAYPSRVLERPWAMAHSLNTRLYCQIFCFYSPSQEKWFPKSQQNSSGILKAVTKGAMRAWERPLFPKTKNFYAKERDIHPCPPFVFAFSMVLIGNAILIECSQTCSNFHTSSWIILGTIPIELHGYSYFGKEFSFPKCILVMVGFLYLRSAVIVQFKEESKA